MQYYHSFTQRKTNRDDISDSSLKKSSASSNRFNNNQPRRRGKTFPLSFEENLHNVEDKSQKYRDHEFPNNLNSLIGSFSAKALSNMGNSIKWWESLIWLSLDEIYGENNYKIFTKGGRPSDVIQGELPDCWVLASLSALAQRPGRISNLFKAKEVNKEGFYEIALCDAGIWKTVKIDDYIPCCPETRKPVFAHGGKKKIWVHLVQKALAKINGCYARLSQGFCGESLHNLTAAPTTCYFIEDNNHKEITKAILKGRK